MENPQHLIIDLLECKRDLTSVVDALEFLKGMASTTNMQVIDYVGKSFGPDQGVTAVLILAESAFTLHSYPEHRAVYLDFFSCKPFDTEMVKRLTCKHFRTSRMYTTSPLRLTVPDDDVDSDGTTFT